MAKAVEKTPRILGVVVESLEGEADDLYVQIVNGVIQISRGSDENSVTLFSKQEARDVMAAIEALDSKAIWQEVRDE